MVSLALNKQLQHKLNSVKQASKVKQSSYRLANQNEDPDFVPDDDFHNLSEDDSLSSVICNQTTSTTKKINVLSDIRISPAANSCDRNQNIVSWQPIIIANEENSVKGDLDIETFVREHILQDIIIHAVDKAQSNIYTKKGEKRKRRKFDDSLNERKKRKMVNKIKEHGVKKSCTCKMNCAGKITYIRQMDLNKQYWTLPKDQQKQFVYNCIKRDLKKRNAQFFS